MGMIFAGNFVDIDEDKITARAEDGNYPVTNILDLWHLMRHFRCQDANTNDWLFKIDLGATTALSAIFLNDVNFDKAVIQGNDTDSWALPGFSQTFSIAKDSRVLRYKAICLLSGFNHRWLRIFIPTDATRVVDPSVWKIATIVLIPNLIELQMNPDFGYKYWADKPFKDNAKQSGGKERIGLGQHKIWHGELPFGKRKSIYEAELLTIDALDNAQPLIFYENRGLTQHAYLCLRDSAFKLTVIAGGINGEVVRFEELV